MYFVRWGCSLGPSQEQLAPREKEKEGFSGSFQPSTHFPLLVSAVTSHRRETDGTGCKYMPSFLLYPRTSCSCRSDRKLSAVHYLAGCSRSAHLRQSSRSHSQHLYNGFFCKELWERKALVSVSEQIARTAILKVTALTVPKS